MKCVKIWILSFFILFSTVDLSVINLVDFHYGNTQKSAIADVMKVQYDLFQQTKIIVGNICKTIVNDVEFLLTPPQTKPIFFDTYKQDLKLYTENYFNFAKSLFLGASSKNSFILKNSLIKLFFFGFIFIFLLKYLGLLFTFGKKTILHHDIKAYGI